MQNTYSQLLRGNNESCSEATNHFLNKIQNKSSARRNSVKKHMI